jgi:hypothetical protein
MEKNKKMAAAMAAVTAYIKTEEEMASAGMEIAAPAQAEYRHSGIWGVSGRQSQMQLRHLMQLRTFQKSKLR